MMAEDVKIFTTNHKTSRIDIPMCEQGSQGERPVSLNFRYIFPLLESGKKEPTDL